MWVRFNRDILVTGVAKRVLYQYSDGQVANVSDTEATRWLTRGVAVRCDAPAVETSPPPEPPAAEPPEDEDSPRRRKRRE